MKLEHISKSLKDTEKIVQLLYNKLYNKVNLLIGDLGSGKTTFVRFLQTFWDKTAVTSPTLTYYKHIVVKIQQFITLIYTGLKVHWS